MTAVSDRHVGMTAGEDAARVSALRALEVLDTPPEDRFDRITRLAQQLFGVSTAGVNLVDADRQFTKSAVGRLRQGDMAREDSLCTYTIQGEGMLEIPDALQDPAWASHPAVVGEIAARFYAGVPLHAPTGERVGALCLIDGAPRTLTGSEQELLRGLADLVERELASTADLEGGREVQRRLLPRRPPQIDGWEVAGTCVQRNAVGGDFYDWQQVGDGVQLMLCDVMGKGLAAALLAAGVRVVARAAGPHHSLSSTMHRVADDLGDDLDETGSFVTAFAARIDSDGGLEYIDAGHGLAFVVGPRGTARRLTSDDLPIGAIPGDTWTPRREEVARGECLVVVSDGLLDVHAGVDELAVAVGDLATSSASADDIARAVAASAGRATTDDVTVLVARREAA